MSSRSIVGLVYNKAVDSMVKATDCSGVHCSAVEITLSSFYTQTKALSLYPTGYCVCVWYPTCPKMRQTTLNLHAMGVTQVLAFALGVNKRKI